LGTTINMDLNLEDVRDLSNMGPVELLYHLADTLLGTMEKQIESPMHLLSDFVESVTWSEPFILGLIVFQIVVLTAVLVSRRKLVLQVVWFVFIAVSVFFAEPLNNWGRQNWPSFSTQNYFDRNGLFAMIFFAGPLLLIANVILVNLSVRTMLLAIRVSRMKMRVQAASTETNAQTNGHDKTD